MSSIAPEVFHEERALRTLSDYFRGKTNIPSFARLFGLRAQDFEEYAWDVIYGRLLLGNLTIQVPVYQTIDEVSETTEAVDVATDAVGICLEQLGKLVGAPRRGLDDTNYQQAIRLRIRTNRSFGRSSDVLEIAILSVPPGTPIKYYEGYPGRFQVWIKGLPGPRATWEAIARGRMGGSYGTLVYTTPEQPDEEVIYFTSVAGGAATRGVLSSTHGAINGKSRLAAAAVA